MREIYTKQSLWSKILNNIFIFTNSKKNSSSEEEAKRFISRVSKKKYNLKNLKNFTLDLIDSEKVYTFNGSLNQKNSRIILYVHGGNFVERANKHQLSFAKKIAIQTNSILVFPFYELLPEGNYKKMNELLSLVYKRILLTEPKEIIFLGDSAGGGSVLSFAMQLRNVRIFQPSNIILLSPWLDLSMSNPQLYNDAKKDKMNDVDGIRYEGFLWSAGDDVYNPIISPMYGSFENLGKISLIFGGQRILSSECMKFDEILNNAKIDHNFLFYKNEGHDFAAYPTREGRKAIKEIADIINNS